MPFVQAILGSKRPDAIRPVMLPRRKSYSPSPADWRDEVIYFLLPDRFSDGNEAARPLLDPANASAARPAGFAFNRWADSGGNRYQGGSISGIRSKLDYIRGLGATTLWVGPVFKQRAYANDFHGYAIQDFLEVDPRLGTRKDLVDLVAAAHQKGMRVLLDIVFNHTANTWIYQNGQDQPPFLPFPGFYQKGLWRNGTGGLTAAIAGDDDGVYPRELQIDEYYTRAGEGNLGAGDIQDPHAEFRRTDFDGDRKINYDGTAALDDVARCYKYWIALTDCDGLRLDTLKHVPQDVGRNFCGSLKEFAANLGKKNFFLVGEVAGSNGDADYYLQILGSNLDATLDIGELRPTLTAVAKGLSAPGQYFNVVGLWDDALGSHRDAGKHRVSILDDHDCVAGAKLRFSTDASSDHQVVAGVAIQLFTLGIPCIYYGTEQAFAGPEKALRDQFLSGEGFGGSDRFLREAMFGPANPRGNGLAGIGPAATSLDKSLPGFGPFGTAGAHCFNPSSAAYTRIAALAAARDAFPALRYGRQYQRPISNFGAPFTPAAAGELITWSRILDDEELLCVVNGNGAQNRGADVLVDAALNSPGAPGRPPGAGTPFMQVVVNSGQAAAIAAGTPYAGPHPSGQKLPVLTSNGTSFVQIRDLPPAEVLVLTNRP